MNAEQEELIRTTETFLNTTTSLATDFLLKEFNLVFADVLKKKENKPIPPIEEAYNLADAYAAYKDQKLPNKPLDEQDVYNDMADIACLLAPFIGEVSNQDNRNAFMEFFRSDVFNECTTTDDCIEVFSTCMKGSDDFTVGLLESIFNDYSVPLTVKKVVDFDHYEHCGTKWSTPRGGLLRMITCPVCGTIVNPVGQVLTSVADRVLEARSR